MDADIENLVLSGELFNGKSGSSSPARSASPDWPEDHSETDYNSDDERSKAIDKTLAASTQQQSIGMGTGRTGVKGVIRDRAEAEAISRSKRAKEIQELNKRMEKASLGGKTFLEEERERQLEKVMLEGTDSVTFEEKGTWQPKQFGHLREVGIEGFLPAIEKEEKDVWVIVHIYDPSLNRCDILDDTLSQLARTNPRTKFIRTRAKALGFASISLTSKLPTLSHHYDEEDEDDPYSSVDENGPQRENEAYDNDDDEYDDSNTAVDTDMLPTLLVYRAGELVFNWVRVDWEAGQEGMESFLTKHRVLPTIGSSDGNLGFLSDEDDSFEDEDELDL